MSKTESRAYAIIRLINTKNYPEAINLSHLDTGLTTIADSFPILTEFVRVLMVNC